MGPALSPAVHGARVFARRIFPLHAVGLLLGGLALGLIAAAAGAAVGLIVPGSTLRPAVGGVVLLYAVAEVGPWRLWRPHSLWQVPEAFRRTPYVGSMAFLWGMPLGFGWATANVTAAFLVTFLAAIALPPGVAVATGLAFSGARAGTLLLTVGASDFETLADRFEHLGGYQWTARILTAVIGVSLALVLFAVPNP